MEVPVPNYSYACTACDNRFDIAQAFTDDTLTTCENCSGRLRKLFGSVGVVFKGSGFYRTDSRDSTQNSHSSSTKSADKSGSTEKSAGTGDSSSKDSSSNGSSSNGSSSNGSSSGAGTPSSSKAASG